VALLRRDAGFVAAPRGRAAPDELVVRRRGGSGSRQIGQFWTKRLWRQNVGTGIPC
jgi:hypothetical protein